MTHTEFVEGWENGDLEVQVDRSAALRIANGDVLPERYQHAHIFWTWVWFLSIPGGIAAAIWIEWWIGLALLFLLCPALFKASRKAACQFMIDHALESEEFFDYARQNKVLSIAVG